MLMFILLINGKGSFVSMPFVTLTFLVFTPVLGMEQMLVLSFIFPVREGYLKDTMMIAGFVANGTFCKVDR